MFKVVYLSENGPVVSNFETKEALIHELVRKEFRFSWRWEKGHADYVPSVFADLAMNPNDRRSEFNGHILDGWFPYLASNIVSVPRRTMVYEDGSVIDIRPWLPEFRAELARMLQPGDYHFVHSGAKPKFRKPFRRTCGLKRSLCSTVDCDRGDILEVVGHIPNKMNRKTDRERGCVNRNFEFSWKRNTKARKGWQRHRPAADMVDMKRAYENDEEEYDDLLLRELLEWDA